MKTSMAVGLLALVLSTLAPAQTAEPAPERKTPTTLGLLKQRIAEVSLVDLPFDQVIDWLSQTSNTQIVVRWQPLADAGISRDKAVTLNVKNLRFSQILWLLMNDVAGSDVKLAYRASGNLILLSTADDLGNEIVTSVYDVSDLLTHVPKFTGGPQVEVNGQQGGGGEQRAFGQSAAGDEPGEQPPNAQPGQVDPEMAQLIEIIQQSIEPESWLLGGGRGTIMAFRNQLIVRNNLRVHQLLGGPVAAGE